MKKKLIMYVGIVLGFLALSYLFVPQVLGGKIVNQSDISGYTGMSHEANEWNKQNPSDPALWTGAMFSGMPTTTINVERKGDVTQVLYDFLLLGKRPATYLFVSLLGAFLLMLALGINPWLAVGGAIAVTFCAFNIQIIQVGHNTKMQALAFLPWVLASIIFTYKQITKRKKQWLLWTLLGASFFGLSLSFQIKANHPQITYYLAIMVLIYALAFFIQLLCSKEGRSKVGRFFVASTFLLVLGLVGIATNANKLLPLQEYTQYSNRGGSSSGETKGVDLGYATAWSYGWEELPNILIPNFNGGASDGSLNPDKSETGKLLKRAGQPNLRQVCKHLPLYWGPQPFTAGPMYIGAITVFLFILGLGVCRGRERWWAVACTVLAVLLAVGNNFLPFTEFFYHHAPMYNKFRTVSMALTVLQFTLPVLGFMALDKVLKAEISRDTFLRKGGLALGISAGFCLLCAIAPSIAGDFVSAADARQPEVLSNALSADRASLLRADALRSFALIVASFVLILWGYSIPKSAKETFATHPEMGFARRRTASMLVCVLVLFDLFVVGKRYLGADDFVTPKQFNGQFALRPVDKMILEDTDPSYRVLDLTVNIFNDSHPSYWHKNIGGYAPAKLQRYQEFIESTLTPEINQLYRSLQGVSTISEAQERIPDLKGLSELNCRYIILGAENAPLVNPYAKGAAWFENGQGTIDMLSYSPNELRYRYSCEEESLAVFSEVYYPKGWTLCAEDEELEILLYDDVLRSAVLPAGEHELVMKYEPASFKVGRTVSTATSVLLILAVLGSGAVVFVNRKKEE